MATTTAAQRRESARRNFNTELSQFPGHELLAMLSEKWVTLVIGALSAGSLRHSDLSRAVVGASQKMLTQTLRRLERDGLITRKVTASIPPRVDYELTTLGHSLLPVQRAILAWGQTHIEEVHAARLRYDGDDH